MAVHPDVEIAVDAAPPQAAVSWGAIFAGTVIAAGLTFLLMILGAGFGLSVVSPWPGASATAASVAIGGIIWLVVTQWLSSAVGGYVAGRLRTRRPDLQADETFFRDSAHGLAVWATASLIVAAIAGSIAASAVGAGTRAAATVASGAAEGAGQAAGALADADPTAYVVDTLFRSGATPSAGAPAAAAPAATPDAVASDAVPGDPTAAPTAGATTATAAPAAAAPASDAAATRAEAGRILVHGLAADAFPAEDRTYLASLVARTAGIGQDEAAARVDQTIGALDAAKAEARAAAEAARKAAVTASLLAALALFVGAFIAAAAAALGGADRDAPYTTLGMARRPAISEPQTV